MLPDKSHVEKEFNAVNIGIGHRFCFT